MRKAGSMTVLPCDVTKILNGNGVIKRYYANNNTHKLINLERGRRHGIQKEWHENGQKKAEVLNSRGGRERRFSNFLA